MDGYTVILSPSPRGTWAAFCPAMPGASAQAESRDEVLREIALVMEAWTDIAAADEALVVDERPGAVVEALASVIGDRASEGWPLTVETVVVTPATPVAA